MISFYTTLFGPGDGYGHSAERMILGLEAAGEDVRCEPGWSMSAPETLIPHVLAKPHVPCDVRVIYAPPMWRIPWRPAHAGQATIAFSMWESDYVPDLWRPHFAQVDVVAAPSRFCQHLFQDHCPTDVVYVPLGVDHAFYAYRRRTRSGPFTVLHSATGMDDPRKGAREAYAAFRDAFPRSSDVRLILRAKHGDIDVNGDPRVEKRIGYLTEAQKRALLYEADVYLYPSMGEGFGLQVLEAVASGLPTICSANTGMLDYEDLVYPVACDPVPSGQKTPTVPSCPGHWMKPRHEELVAQLRGVERLYELATAHAESAAATVRRRWGWEQTVVALRGAIATAKARHAGRLSAA